MEVSSEERWRHRRALSGGAGIPPSARHEHEPEAKCEWLEPAQQACFSMNRLCRKAWHKIWKNSEERPSGCRARTSRREDSTNVPHEDAAQRSPNGGACDSRRVFPCPCVRRMMGNIFIQTYMPKPLENHRGAVQRTAPYAVF